MPATKAKLLLEQLGVTIDPRLLDLALTHRSYAYEHGQIPNNERLEFLGDAVLGVIVTEYLYTHFPDFPEGRLAKMRAAVVSAAGLAEVARDYELGALIKLGKGELSTRGPDKSSILADTVEAIIGAAFLTDADDCRRLVSCVFYPLVDQAARLGPGLDWKTSLQEASSARGLGVPSYQVESDGPAHARTFTAWVTLDGQCFPSATGTSRKHAEQQAAQLAFEALQQADGTSGAGGSDNQGAADFGANLAADSKTDSDEQLAPTSSDKQSERAHYSDSTADDQTPGANQAPQEFDA